MSKIRTVWGFLNSPVDQLIKPLHQPSFDEVEERGDDYWQDSKEPPFDHGKASRELRKNIEENAFPVRPTDLTPCGDGPDTQDGVAMDQLSAANDVFTLSNSRVSDVQLSWYVSQGFIGYQSCAIIAQHWLVNRACSMPGKDAIRNGFQITSVSGNELKPEVIQDICTLDKQFGLNDQMKEFSKMNRVFGIRIVLFQVVSKDKKYYEKPFNIDGVTPGSYQGMVQIDPYWITPELDGDAAANPASANFYNPTYWRVNGKLYHHSHLVITRYANVADVLKPNYIYGGIPLTQMIYERCYAAERAANESPELLLTKRLFIIRADTKKVLANFGKFMERMASFVSLKNNQGVQVIDKLEEFDQHDTTLSDVSTVIEGQYDIVAAISEVPASKLLGRQITGLNSEGNGDRRNYTDVLESEQERIDPLIDRHHLLLMKSHIEPKRPGQPAIIHTWNSVNTPTEKEAAEIRKLDMETASAAVLLGAISSEEVRAKIITDKDSGFAINEKDSGGDMDYSDFDADKIAARLFPNSPETPSA